jgi:NAD(P)-dependent dehydrogenase (short-subunit alcohol dehydrogenase family)
VKEPPVCPAFHCGSSRRTIATELFERANPAGSPRTQAIIDSVPVKRIGTPEDVAHAAGFFLDELSGFVTGQVLYVCGLTVVSAPP